MQNLRLVVIFLVVSCVLTPLKMFAAAEVSVVNQLTKIDLNTAKLEALQHAFKGIGSKRAQAIIQYRETHGPLKSVRELAEVKGIGASFVDRNEAELEKTFTVK